MALVGSTRKCSTEPSRQPAAEEVAVGAAKRALSLVPLTEAARHAGMSRAMITDIRDGHRQARACELLKLPETARDEAFDALLESFGRVMVAAPESSIGPATLDEALSDTRRACLRFLGMAEEIGAFLAAADAGELEDLADALGREAFAVREWARLAKRERVLGTGRKPR